MDAQSPLGAIVYGSAQICAVAPDGTAVVVAFGGTPPYSYLWNSGEITPQLNGLSEGEYSITVTGAAGGTASDSFYVNYWEEGLWLIDSVGNATCSGGGNDGLAHVGVMSGTSPYIYTWNTGDTIQDIQDLSPGHLAFTH